jgi:hypothetical protein
MTTKETLREARIAMEKSVALIAACKLDWSYHWKSWFLNGFDAEFQFRSLYCVDLIIERRGKLW